MRLLRRFGLVLGVCLGAGTSAWGGGSGLNVLVVVNQNSSNSVKLGNYYCERRQIPPQSFLRINWTGGNTDWTLSDFTTYLYNPLLDRLKGNQLTNQIDYVVLSMDIPYRVIAPGSAAINSTTSTLFYGFKSDSTESYNCPLAPGSSNSYAASEGIFRATPPVNALSNSFLVTMITSSNLALAKQIVDQGVSGDSTFPSQTAYLVKSEDVARNVRYWTSDDAIFNTRLRGDFSLVRTNGASLLGLGTILGAQTGSYGYPVAGVTFVPGAMADNLTSYGGLLFQDSAGQLDILALLQAGAAGSYGTVDEPCNYLQKFPAPQNYFYQARGFSLAECYYQSVANSYQGVVVGEPLSAPFARPATGGWQNLPADSVLTGTTNLTLAFSASDSLHPVQQVDLFIDGTWAQSLTNIPPSEGNVLSVLLNGWPMQYVVPGGATLGSAAAGLAEVLNEEANTNATQIAATLHGDRIELHSMDLSRPGPQVSLSVGSDSGGGEARTTFLSASGTIFLDTVAYGLRGFLITNTPASNAYLQFTFTKTNSTQVRVGVTNSSGQATLTELVQHLYEAIRTDPELQGPDGLTLQDLITDTPTMVEFNLLPNSPGWKAAQVQAAPEVSADLAIQPANADTLEDNLNDLQPRAQLYLTVGVTNLAFSFPFHSLAVADGYHELTAVAYEGSHVRTQVRVAQNVRVQNGPLAASFVASNAGPEISLDTPLVFTVTANTNSIGKIELFSTGGLLSSTIQQSSATFSVPATDLGMGLHPFYALVTGQNGAQYRTETLWFRIVGPRPTFLLSITAPPPVLSWPASPGSGYEILTSTNLSSPFEVLGRLVATNTTAVWADTNSLATQRFYRVRTSN